MNLDEYPDWVWQVVVDLQFYEDVHPPLYRMNSSDEIGYERATCPNEILTSVPSEVKDVAKMLSSKAVVVPSLDYMKVAGE